MTEPVKKRTEETAFRRQRKFTGALAILFSVLASGYTLYHLIFILAVFERFKVYIINETHTAISLGLILAITFLITPATEKARKDRLPWYDALLAVLSLVGWGYIAIFFQSVITVRGPLSATPEEIILGIISILLVLEATRRVIGWILPALALLFIIHAMFGSYFPGVLYTRSFSLTMIVGNLYLWPSGILGTPMVVAATMVIAFMIFSEFLQRSGAGGFFMSLASSLFGHVRGGPAKVAIFASALFGTISGSPTSNVASTGVLTIPLMKSIGYSSAFAGGVESVASTGGLILPPVMGAVAFIMVGFLGISYGQLIIWAALPAILYYFAVFMMVDLEAAKKGLKGLPRQELPALGRVVKEGWQYSIPLLVLLVFLIGLQYSPSRSAIYSLFALILIGLFKKETRMGWGSILRALEGTARVMPIVALACATAGIIIGSLTMTGLGVSMAIILKELAGGSLLVLLLLASVASYILGMGMPSIPVYITVATIIAPAMIGFGVPPVAAHLFVFYWAMVSFFTPPVALATYVAAGISGASPMSIGLHAVRLGAASYILPFMFVYKPSLLLMGAPGEVALTVVTALVGVIALAAGLEGFFWRRVLWWERVPLIAGALLMIMPGWQVNLAGLALILLGVFRQLLLATRERLGTRKKPAG
ncbi:MAG: TRAP transporter permease [Chloroflexota bacterium]